MSPKIGIALICAALLTSTMTGLPFAGPAFGHAFVLKSDPANKAVVRAPKVISVTFSDKLAPAFSGFDVTMGGNMKVPLKTSLSPDGKTITAKPQGAMMPGGYKIHWHAAATDDGHRTEGSFSFSVKQ